MVNQWDAGYAYAMATILEVIDEATEHAEVRGLSARDLVEAVYDEVVAVAEHGYAVHAA